MFAGPGRREIQWKGEYREVVEPERLVLTLSDQPGEDAYELVTVVLADLGDGRTEMRFQQRGRMSAEQYERAGQGWSSFFDRLDEHLADA
ncbi:MAG: SRPBCC family protein [Solirubrobacterales bacterium]